MSATLAEKLGILEKIKKIKEKGGGLSSFKMYGVIKTDGSSEELHEWLDSFVKPLDKENFAKFYQNPELFFEYGRKNMEIFLEVCGILEKYAGVVLDENFSQMERDTALLMAMHLTFTASDMIYKHDRFLEVSSPEISPLGKIYEDIYEILEKAAKAKGYDKTWIKEKFSLLISLPTYVSFQVRMLLDCLALFKRKPSLKALFLNKNAEQIIPLIEKNTEAREEIKKIEEKYQIDIVSVINMCLNVISVPEALENIEKHIKIQSEKVKSTFQELKEILDDKDYKKLEASYEKIKHFKELQEFTSSVIKKSESMEALGKMIMAMEYFKKNINRFIKEQYIEEIRRELDSFEEGLPLGDFYFVPRLRKIIFLLLEKGYLNEDLKTIYDKEVEIWRKV